MNDQIKAIRESARIFDIHSQESELDAAQFVDEMSGDGDETHADDINVPDYMPLPAALTLVETSRKDGFRFMQEIAEEMLAQFSAKSEDVKATQDARTLNHQMAMGVKALLVEWGARVAEAEQRVQQSTPEERRKMGVTNVRDILESEPQAEAPKRVIVVGPSSEEKPSSRVPSAGVQANTKRAQDWLNSDASRS